jgi:hypothetical protein
MSNPIVNKYGDEMQQWKPSPLLTPDQWSHLYASSTTKVILASATPISSDNESLSTITKLLQPKN